MSDQYDAGDTFIWAYIVQKLQCGSEMFNLNHDLHGKAAFFRTSSSLIDKFNPTSLRKDSLDRGIL